MFALGQISTTTTTIWMFKVAFGDVYSPQSVLEFIQISFWYVLVCLKCMKPFCQSNQETTWCLETGVLSYHWLLAHQIPWEFCTIFSEIIGTQQKIVVDTWNFRSGVTPPFWSVLWFVHPLVSFQHNSPLRCQWTGVSREKHRAIWREGILLWKVSKMAPCISWRVSNHEF